MKTVYFKRLDNTHAAIADLVLMSASRALGVLAPEGSFLITRINVPIAYRRKGLGTEMLKEIIEDADKEGVTLVLECVPSDMKMTQRVLAKWYEKHGFSTHQHLDWIMMRRPRGKDSR